MPSIIRFANSVSPSDAGEMAIAEAFFTNFDPQHDVLYFKGNEIIRVTRPKSWWNWCAWWKFNSNDKDYMSRGYVRDLAQVVGKIKTIFSNVFIAHLIGKNFGERNADSLKLFQTRISKKNGAFSNQFNGIIGRLRGEVVQDLARADSRASTLSPAASISDPEPEAPSNEESNKEFWRTQLKRSIEVSFPGIRLPSPSARELSLSSADFATEMRKKAAIAHYNNKCSELPEFRDCTTSVTISACRTAAEVNEVLGPILIQYRTRKNLENWALLKDAIIRKAPEDVMEPFKQEVDRWQLNFAQSRAEFELDVDFRSANALDRIRKNREQNEATALGLYNPMAVEVGLKPKERGALKMPPAVLDGSGNNIKEWVHRKIISDLIHSYPILFHQCKSQEAFLTERRELMGQIVEETRDKTPAEINVIINGYVVDSFYGLWFQTHPAQGVILREHKNKFLAEFNLKEGLDKSIRGKLPFVYEKMQVCA